jgi:hypothetical protein
MFIDLMQLKFGVRLCLCLVGMKGLEPSRLAARAPKARVYTNFTTSPRSKRNDYIIKTSPYKIPNVRHSTSELVFDFNILNFIICTC